MPKAKSSTTLSSKKTPYAKPPAPIPVDQDDVEPGKPYEEKDKGYIVRHHPAENRIDMIYASPGQPPTVVAVDTRTFYHMDPDKEKMKRNDNDEEFKAAQRITRLLDIKKDAGIAPSVVEHICDLVYEDICKDVPFNLDKLEKTILQDNAYRITRTPMLPPNDEEDKYYLENRMPRRQAFQEAGPHPSAFIENPYLVYTIANQVIDPADRKKPADNSVFFPKSNEKFVMEKSFLDLFGFPDCSLESYRVNSTTHAYQLKINDDDPQQVTEITSIDPHLPYPTFYKRNKQDKKVPVSYFDGNTVKNTCITKNMSNPALKRYLSSLLVSKEMGDVFQVLMAFIYQKMYPQKQPIIVSNDMVVFCLSLMINMSCIFSKFEHIDNAWISYVFDQKENKVIVEYFFRKCTELLNHNHAVLRDLQLTYTDEPLSLIGPNCSLKGCDLVKMKAQANPQTWSGEPSGPLSMEEPVWYSIFTPDGVKVVHRQFIDTLYRDSLLIHQRMVELIRQKANELFSWIGPAGVKDSDGWKGAEGYNPNAHKEIISFVKWLIPRYKLNPILTKRGRTKTPYPGRCHYDFPRTTYSSYTVETPEDVFAELIFNDKKKYYNSLLLDYELVMTAFKTQRTVIPDKRLKTEEINDTAVKKGVSGIQTIQLPDEIRVMFSPYLVEQGDEKKDDDMQDGGGGSTSRRKLFSLRASHKSHKSHKSYKSHKSHKSHKSSPTPYFTFPPVYYDYSPEEGDKFIDSLKKYMPAIFRDEEKTDKGLYRIDLHHIFKEQVYSYLYKNYDADLIQYYEVDILSYVYQDFEINGHTLFNKGLERLLEKIMKEHILPANKVRQQEAAKRVKQPSLSSSHMLKRFSQRHLSRKHLTVPPSIVPQSKKRTSVRLTKPMSKGRRMRPSSSSSSSKPFSSTRRRSSSKTASSTSKRSTSKRSTSKRWSPAMSDIREMSGNW